MKKVLIIAYDFPPARTSGVYRTVKFAKFMIEYGWQPVILTVKNYPKELLDETLLKEIPPDTHIYYSYSWELKRFEKKVFNRFYKKKEQPSVNDDLINPVETRLKRTLVFLIKKYLFSPLSSFTHGFLYTPDDKIGWLPMAVCKGLKAIRREKIDLIYSTSPPETNHVVGLLLKRLTGIPWLVDFRDPWTNHYNRKNRPHLQLKVEDRLEHGILRKADAIVHASSGFSRLSEKTFTDISPDKFHVITNGFDEDDFKGLTVDEIYGQNKTSFLNFVSVGTIYENSGFYYFLKGLERVLRNKNIGPNLKVSLIGDIFQYWRELLSKPPFDGHINLLGYKQHQPTVRLMMAADVLLLTLPHGDILTRDKIIPGKIFELMRSGRPIFIVGCEGEASRIIEKSGLGNLVQYDDIDKIEKSVIEYYHKKRKGRLDVKPDWDYINQFNRKALTGKLVELFNLIYDKYNK